MLIDSQLLDPWYVTGICDGEGSFSFFLNTETKKRKNGYISVYRYWKIVFSIRLRSDDGEILKRLQSFFGCGNLFTVKVAGYHDSITYNIFDYEDLKNKIIPHFDKYPPQAKKRDDYKLWREAFFILYNSYKLRKLSKNPAITQQISKEQEIRLIQIKTLLAERLTRSKKTMVLDAIKNKLRGKNIQLISK